MGDRNDKVPPESIADNGIGRRDAKEAGGGVGTELQPFQQNRERADYPNSARGSADCQEGGKARGRNMGAEK